MESLLTVHRYTHMFVAQARPMGLTACTHRGSFSSSLLHPSSKPRASFSGPRASSSSSHEHPLYHRQSDEELMSMLRERRKESREESTSTTKAKVWLLGCGPGSADLLTVRGLRLMQKADVVLYDRLVSEEVLSLVNPSALMVYVGKQEGYHTRSQESISELLGVYASELGAGANVLRLKGGDPYVFGRGGEEAEYLRSVGVDVGVVPGITSACAIGAELGIPLTHRTLATSVRFLTGHARENGQSDIDEAMATAFDRKTTLVIYMGLRTLDRTVETLVAGGLPRDTPAAAVEKGCTPDQRVVYSTLENLYDDVQSAHPKLVSPTLIVIGEVVKLAPGYGDGEMVEMPVGTAEREALPAHDRGRRVVVVERGE